MTPSKTQEFDRERGPIEQLIDSLAGVARIDYLLALAVLALTLGLIDLIARMPLPGADHLVLFQPLISGGYLYLTLRRFSSGHKTLPSLRVIEDTWDDLLFPLVQIALVGTWPVALLFGVVGNIHTIGYSLAVSGLPNRVAYLGMNSRTFVVLIIEFIYLPAALCVAASSNRIWTLLDPTLGMRCVFRVGYPYVQTFIAFQVLFVTFAAAYNASTWLVQAFSVPLASRVLHHLFYLWIPLAQARILGTFAERYASRLNERGAEAIASKE